MNAYDLITEKIVEQLNNGIIPWRRPWHGTLDGAISYTSRKPYSLLNQFLLGKDGEWLTFNEIQKLGGSIKKGEKASFVTFWKWFVPADQEDEENPKSIPLLRYYNVWHIDQCEGIKTKLSPDKGSASELNRVQSAEDIIKNYFKREAVKLFTEKSNRAYYSPSRDEVHVPLLEQYDSEAEYYSTLFHEMTHSTGHASRMNRKEVVGVAHFGDENYSKEELVAEMGAAFLVSQSGIDNEKAFKNSVAYIQSWARALKRDPKMFVCASSKAQKAVEFIINGAKAEVANV